MIEKNRGLDPRIHIKDRDGKILCGAAKVRMAVFNRSANYGYANCFECLDVDSDSGTFISDILWDTSITKADAMLKARGGSDAK